MVEQHLQGWRGRMGEPKTDLSVLIKHFEVHNKTEGKSPRTVKWYNEVLGLLYRWLKATGRSTDLHSIDEMVIREYIINLQDRPGTKGKRASSHTVYNRVNALRSFFAWLKAQGLTEEHVLQKLKQPRTSELVIENATGMANQRAPSYSFGRCY